MAAIFAGLFFCGLIAGIIGSNRGQGFGTCFFLGVLLGPIGVLIALTTKPTPEVEAQRQLAVEEARRKLAEGS